MSKKPFAPWAVVCLLGLVVVGVAGCGPSGPVMYAITGTVTFEGAPVEEGTITLEDPATGVAQQAELSSTGTYAIELQEGTYKVCVEPPMEERQSRADTPPDYAYKQMPNIPPKYHSTFESGLSHTVSQAGTFDVDMQP